MSSTKPARTTVFISYSHKDRRWLGRIQVYLKDLERRGVIDLWDDTKIKPGSDWREEINQAIESAKVAVLLISADFLASDFIAQTELPLLLAAAGNEGLVILPVIIGPSLFEDHPILSKFQTVNPPSLPLNRMGRGKQEELLVKLSRDIINALGARSFEPPIPNGPRIKGIHLSYDWEDRPEARELVRALRNQGVKISWDQDWPHYSDFDKEIEQAIRNADAVTFYSTSHSRYSEWMGEEIKISKRENKKIVVIDKEPGYRCEQLTNEEGINIAGISTDKAAQSIINKLQPLHNTSAQIESSDSRKTVRELLQDAFEANLNIPSDAITDKIFFSDTTCTLVEQAYDKALRLPNDDPDRLQAILEYGRLKRFRGEWEVADNELSVAKNVASGNKELLSAYYLESGAIEFERGATKDGERLVREALTHIQRRGVTTDLVNVLRQLGNMLWEQGDVKEARQHLSAAMYFAEYLKHTTNSGSMSSVAADVLRIDCIRELASLLLKQQKFDDGFDLFQTALKELEDEKLSKAGEYIKGVIFYHLGRAYLLYKRDVRGSLEHLENSLRILRKYDNPVRLAFVYDYIGRALTDQHLDSNLKKAQKCLEKAKRIRESCKHEYLIADTELGLGKLHLRLNNVSEAVEAFKNAQRRFNRLGKTGPEGSAFFALAMAYAKAAEMETDSAKAKVLRDEARASLLRAKHLLHSVGLFDIVREVEFELLKLGENDYSKNLPLERLVNLGKARNYDFSLNEIGEYVFHKWIKEVGGTWAGSKYADVNVGIGDDAAVIDIKGSNTYELVVTTDAAPGSISRSPEIESGKYAAKFSVVHSLSDVLAMGAKPIAVLLNLYLKRNAKLEYAMNVIETVSNEARKYGAALVGGDLKERAEQSVGCVGIGLVEKGQAIRRNGAKPGHVVAITQARMPDGSDLRRIGCRWAQEIIEDYKLSTDKQFRKLYRDNWKRDLLFLPCKEMMAGAQTRLIKSAIDTSDGVLACLQLLGQESGVGFVLEEERIEEIIDENVKEVARLLDLRPSQFLFNAGHDWEIVLTVEQNDFDSARRAFQSVGGDLARLGTVCTITDDLRNGVAFVMKETKKKVWIPFFTDEKFVRRSYEDRPLEWEDLKFYLDGVRVLE